MAMEVLEEGFENAIRILELAELYQRRLRTTNML
jgi:hypothetical protein